MVVTLDVSKLSGWSNADALVNMDCMVVTLDVSKLSGWLNAVASQNMPYMVVTLDVSKFSGLSNSIAPWNMPRMFVTAEVSQSDMSALKSLVMPDQYPPAPVSSAEKRKLMSVMPETSQPATGPYVASVEAASSLKAWSFVFRSSLL